jgi:hypothetical protein
MKVYTIFLVLLFASVTAANGQSPVKATILLKDGKTIDVHHFGKLNCENNRYAKIHTTSGNTMQPYRDKDFTHQQAGTHGFTWTPSFRG